MYGPNQMLNFLKPVCNVWKFMFLACEFPEIFVYLITRDKEEWHISINFLLGTVAARKTPHVIPTSNLRARSYN